MANYMAIKELDINNGPGLRTSFWFSGCHFHCDGCHNKEAWDFKAGKKATRNVIDTVVKSMSDVYGEHIDLSILGGEPLAVENIEFCADLIAYVRFEYMETRTVWLWTGYTREELAEELINQKDTKYSNALNFILSEVNVLIDGRYDKNFEGVKYRGSSNQRVIELN